MGRLDGHEGFNALAKLLRGDGADIPWTSTSPAIERARAALMESPQQATARDIAVLVRQALRHEHARRGYAASPSVVIAHHRLEGFREWEELGCSSISSNAGARIEARPWLPDWLTSGGPEGVDGFAASEATRRTFNGRGSVGDPFLSSIGRESYRSPGQRAAVRAALTTPPGGTLVVALPTGEGKSMLFQLAHKVGFSGAPPQISEGVTLVIVPTVALGLNHEQEAISVCGLTGPLAFQGGHEAQNKIIADRILDGTQGLCFASPEAACGTLRPSLRRAAEAGRLRAMVVDEAHLIDQWGAGFRTEFQELSGLRRELMAAAPPEQRMRTLLLSATLTDSSLETLRALFGADGTFESVAAVKLRPEPDYWIADISDPAVREARVLEALNHAPRPAVLYVTQVQHAIAWHRLLKNSGFGRVGLVHGKTSRSDRERIVSQWRNGSLDVVVGTSAFGLGIDYAHARTVIHACVPETLDRFYQEVGRGGRDGRAAMSLILPVAKDFALAKRINKQKLIGVDRGLERWTAMFQAKKPLDGDRFAVRIDGRPGVSGADIDMFGETNTDWNLRTLALMTRAGMLRLLGSPLAKIEGPGDWVEVEVMDERHLETDAWDKKIEPLRRASRQATQQNLALMNAYLADQKCPASILEELYGADRIGRSCSRCALCRNDVTLRLASQPVGEPISPWTPALHPSVERLLDDGRRLLVTYDPNALNRASSRRFSESLARLQRLDVAKLLVLGEQPFDMSRVLEFADKVPFFVSTPTSLAHSRLPPGPEVVLIGPSARLVDQNLAVRWNSPRIFVASIDHPAPDGRALRSVFGGRVLTLEELNARLAQ